MLSKWGYIAEELRKGKVEELALMADKIEEHLKEIYDYTVTMEFTVDLKNDKLNNELHEVVMDGSYCIACFVSNGRCSVCKYGKKYGVCLSKHAEFTVFINKMEE